MLAKVGPEEELFVSLRVATPGRICTGLRTKDFYMPQEANLSLFLILMLNAREGKKLGCLVQRNLNNEESHQDFMEI